MDFRIVNTCNNNCLYCLEQSYRNKILFAKKEEILDEIQKNIWDKTISFYWGNSLLHPNIEEIIEFCKKSWFTSIGILTNTYFLDKNKLAILRSKWLNTIGFYFNSFDEKAHNLLVNWGISLKNLLENIEHIRKSKIFYKAIIHINKQNIQNLSRDIYILYKNFGVKNFEFINYFPFDRPFDEFRNLLEYDIISERKSIDLLLGMLKKLKIKCNFSKFSKDFFWKNYEFYNFKKWILNQIWEEDVKRLWEKNPFCLQENRCPFCFIKDNCQLYGKI